MPKTNIDGKTEEEGVFGRGERTKRKEEEKTSVRLRAKLFSEKARNHKKKKKRKRTHRDLINDASPRKLKGKKIFDD